MPVAGLRTHGITCRALKVTFPGGNMGVGAEYALYNCLVAIAIRAPFLVIVEAVFAGCDYERIQNILLHHYACTRLLEFLKKDIIWGRIIRTGVATLFCLRGGGGRVPCDLRLY